MRKGLHSLAIGHPIVGDFTYASAAARGDSGGDTEPRMMLHSKILIMDLAKSKKARRRDRDGKPAMNFFGDERDKVAADAGDPFPFVDGVLCPVLPEHVRRGEDQQGDSGGAP